MLQLNKLKPAGKKKKRIGRGGSRGGTAGKGHKGQKARSGGSPRVGFEGGQMPLYRRLPKRGFGAAKKKHQIITTTQLEEKFKDGDTIDKALLVEKGLVTFKKGRKKADDFLVKVLGGADITKKLTVIVDAFSESAKKVIEKSGGQAQVAKEI